MIEPKQIEIIRDALHRMKAAGLDVSIQTLYGATGDPTVIIIVPGVSLRQLEEETK